MPITGPSRAPAIPAPSAPPISPPRRSGGASATIHASPPAHEHAPPTPSMSLATSSATGLSSRPNASVAPASSARPTNTVRFGPIRTARMPPGTAASSVPSGYEAVSTPADSFERWSECASPGSSGVIAA